MSFDYIRQYYHVPAELGRRVRVYGRLGVIVEDRGHHLGVNYDDEKPGVVHSAHPTCEVEYLEMGTVRKLTRSQQRYRRFLTYGEGFHSFIDFCQWDAQPERSWNS